MGVFVEDWQASYGSPYLVVPEETSAPDAAQVAEDGGVLTSHDGTIPNLPRLAFVDGVRRVEASLYQVDDITGGVARGVAGAHACGSVLVEDGVPPVYGPLQLTRHVIFGSGVNHALPPVHGGWAWQASSIAESDPEAPLRELQNRMRRAEGELAATLCAEGWLTVVDGPVTYVRARDLPVVGYVKTHHRMLLPAPEHVRVPQLISVGQRTSLFAHGNRYSAYARIATPDVHSGPWSGVIRLELPQSAGLRQCAEQASVITGLLPRFAGVRHRDPRAPQNLQPVGALEKHLRHLLGPSDYATRAVRDAVAQLRPAVPA